MISMNKEEETIRSAVEAIRGVPGLDVELRDGRGGRWVDVGYQGRSAAFLVRYVASVDQDVPAEAAFAPGEPGRVIVSRFIPAGAALALEESGISYLDAEGRAFLRAPDFLVLLQERRKPLKKVEPRAATGRAFDPAGLRVVFSLLVDPEQVNAPYRDLAERNGVSPAAVKYALDDLEQKGFLVKRGKGRGMKRRMVDPAGLGRRWAVAYGDRLRPKFVRGRFRLLDPALAKTWKALRLDAGESCWGGEPAAELYTRRLRAEVLTLYSTAPTDALARSLRLLPDPDGPVEVLTRFWRGDVDYVGGLPVVPKVLAYADLLASNETRNLEVASFLLDPDDENPLPHRS